MLVPLIRRTKEGYEALELDTQTGIEFSLVTDVKLHGVIDVILERYNYDTEAQTFKDRVSTAKEGQLQRV